MSDWKSVLLKRLEERDLLQNKNTCFDTLTYLNEKINKYSTRCQELKSNNFATDLDSALTKIEQLNIQIDNNSKKLEEKETVNNDLIVAYGSAKKDKESMREMYKKLEDKYNKLQEEMAMSKKTVDLINDHVLELQLENNMLQAFLNDKK